MKSQRCNWRNRASLTSLLMNEAGRHIREQYANTAGCTDHVFSMSGLLDRRIVLRSCVDSDGVETQGLQGFDLPVPRPELAISAMWPPRLNADPGHRWLRQKFMTICRVAI